MTLATQTGVDDVMLTKFFDTMMWRDGRHTSAYLNKSLEQQKDDLDKAMTAARSQLATLRVKYMQADYRRNTQRYWGTAARYAAILLAACAVLLALGIDGKLSMWLAYAGVCVLLVVLLVGMAVAAKSEVLRDRSYWNRFYWTATGSVDYGQVGDVADPGPVPTQFCCDRVTPRPGLLYTLYDAAVDADISRISSNPSNTNAAKQLPSRDCLVTELKGSFEATFIKEKGILFWSTSHNPDVTIDIQGVFVPSVTGSHTWRLASRCAYLWISADPTSNLNDTSTAFLSIPRGGSSWRKEEPLTMTQGQTYRVRIVHSNKDVDGGYIELQCKLPGDNQSFGYQADKFFTTNDRQNSPPRTGGQQAPAVISFQVFPPATVG
jgi:Ca2+/Na+ antiporter